VADRFDKFTDRARRSLQTAQEEAVRLGHGQIVAEHLLLGLLADRTSVAAHALARLGVDLDGLASKATAHGASVDPPQPQLGLATSAKQAIELAVEEARALDHHYVGTEHLLLGLLRQESNSAAQELKTQGITLQRARGAIAAILNAPPPAGTRPVRRATATTPPTPEEVDLLFAHLSRILLNPSDRPTTSEPELMGRLSDDGLVVLRFAWEEAQRLNHDYVGTEHILLGLVGDRETPVGRLLFDLGISLERVRDAVELIIGRGLRNDADPPRFTPRAGKVILLGIDEAQGLGDPAAGPEHLLLGIVREGEGIANSVLESLLVNPDKIRSQVLEALGEPPPQVPGPFRTDRLSRLARKALLQAQLAARWYYHPQISTEHLLLGLVRERDGAASHALQELGADLSRVLEQFEALTTEPSGRPTPERVEYTTAARAAIAQSGQEAVRRGHPQAGTGHLLLGVLSVTEGQAQDLLKRLNISADQARLAVEPLLVDEED
jgi:ATP-dependent Clp protease ATP-binding subunit ClpA